MFLSFFDRPFVIPAIILGLGFVFSAVVGSYGLYQIRSLDNTLTVTGSASDRVKADTAKWTVRVQRTVFEPGVQAAYGQVASDVNTVVAYFVGQGIDEQKIIKSTVYSDQEWNSDSNAPRRYNVYQTITMESSDVEKIQQLSQNISQLAAKGVSVSPMPPEYYISTLPDLRVALLGKAVADAKARASEIAKSGNASVGRLRSAGSGVVQVLAPNSTNVEDYGSYDTSTIEKQVMVTARATFLVR